jgi:hypothetical protein
MDGLETTGTNRTLEFGGTEVSGEKVTMLGIAALLKEQLEPVTLAVSGLRNDFTKLDHSVVEMREALSERLDTMEQRLNLTDVRVDKLESLCKTLEESAAPNINAMESKIYECIEAYLKNEDTQHSGSNAYRATVTDPLDKRAVNMVIGNLDGLEDLTKATAWLRDTLAYLNGTAPVRVYAKAGLSGRAQLSAFFLEDIALPSSAGVKGET